MLQKATATLRDKIEKDLTASGLNRAPQEKSNTGRIIWPIYYWQIVTMVGYNGLKKAWDNAVNEGIVGSDDVMRGLGEGEHLIADSNCFSVLASVTKARMLFDRDLFIEKVARKYKLDKAKLVALAEDCKVAGKPALSKRVVEAAQ